MTKQLAPVMRSTFVRATPERAFAAFTDEIAQWWPLHDHSVFLADAVDVSFHDGHLLERSSQGETNEWGEVLSWDPPHSLSMTWHPGAEKSADTVVTVTF